MIYRMFQCLQVHCKWLLSVSLNLAKSACSHEIHWLVGEERLPDEPKERMKSLAVLNSFNELERQNQVSSKRLR